MVRTREIKSKANALAKAYGLRAELLPGVRSVGVQGDGRTYTNVVCLSGEPCDYECLAALSSEITSRLPVNRVVFELAKRRGAHAV